MTDYTLAKDTDAKLDIIEHINQDHTAELMSIVHYYYPNIEMTEAFIKDISNEGMLVIVQSLTKTRELYVEFKLEGDIEEQILYLAYMVKVKQGKDLNSNKKQYFEVIGKERLTQNMIRLILQSQTPLPSNYAGYTYGMLLKVLNKVPERPISDSTSSIAIKLAKKYGNQALLWFLKHLSSKQRYQIVETMNKDVRLYTLRKACSSIESDYINKGYMDIFTHDSSPGSLWTASLNIGDVIFSRNESEDKHEHLSTGQCVLIADETAYPALAGILECWDNTKLPHIIILSQKQSEQAYFLEDSDNQHAIEHTTNYLPKDAQIHRIICNYSEQGSKVIEILKGIDTIDATWGALENSSAKAVRYYLRNERNLSGKQNRIKGYWRADKDFKVKGMT